ncbi:hypothetical protein D9M72_589150 [compost metagenome]
MVVEDLAQRGLAFTHKDFTASQQLARPRRQRLALASADRVGAGVGTPHALQLDGVGVAQRRRGVDVHGEQALAEQALARAVDAGQRCVHVPRARQRVHERVADVGRQAQGGGVGLRLTHS